jgi:hypothetical protein
MHSEYQLPNGEVISLPPYPDIPPCACGKRSLQNPPIYAVVFAAGEVESREEAERRFADSAAFHSLSHVEQLDHRLP